MNAAQLGVILLHVTVATCQNFLEANNIGLEWTDDTATFVYGSTFRMLTLSRKAYSDYLQKNEFKKSGATLLALIYTTREADSHSMKEQASKLSLKHYVHIANTVTHHLGPELMEKLDLDIRCATRQIYFKTLLNDGNVPHADIV